MSEKLKPCPHCGERDELYPSYRMDSTGKLIEPPYAIDCLGCGSDFTPRAGIDAIAAWNRRASDPRLAMAREEMEKIAKDRADWLLDAVACATQDRRFLRGEPEYDEVAGEAILLNAEKAIRVAFDRATLTALEEGK